MSESDGLRGIKFRDEELEKAIDDVGRDRVFDRAEAHGWNDMTPPRWVWWLIVKELRDGVPPPPPRESLSRSLLGSDLV